MNGDWLDYLLLGFAALLAGIVDAVVGGGGMVQLPALFAVYPGAVPAALLGTNKLSAAVGTTGAALQYARTIAAPWPVVAASAGVAFAAALAGAWVVMLLPPEPLRKALPFILLGLLIWTVRSKAGLEHRPTRSPGGEVAVASSGSAAIGFYDGFLGAGTGAFYKLLFVRGLGYDFINAAAPSKLTNVASNLGAVLVFAVAGHMYWGIAAWMALTNFVGGQIGAAVALRYGSAFIRRALVVVVSCLIVKTFHDAYLR
jgi:hypothetical protein